MDLFLNETDPKSIAVYIVMLLWIVLWKGLALWYASKRNSRAWFVLLLVVSTFGILEIVYLFFVLKLRLKMRKLIASIIENCGTTEVNIAVAKYMEIKNQNGEGKSHSDHLSDIATRLSPEIVRSMHRLAEILQEHPELAPDLLPAVEKCLSTLDFSDPRKYVGGLIPRSVPELHERETVRNASSEFLQREERRGAYEKEPAKAEIIPTLQDLLGEEVQTLTM
jgi:hypothetical protein